MSSNNRSRITVDIPGDPALYQPNNLPGWEVVGVVRRGEDDIGALVKNLNTGIYCQINNGVVRSLDQRKIKATLGISNNAGRPQMDAEKRMKARRITISDEDWAKLEDVGGGNASKGVRVLVDFYSKR